MPLSEYIKNIRAKIGNDLLLLPGVTAVVINDRREVLLQLRRDTKTWAPPSGGLEPGENLAQCVMREVLEETGIEVIPESVIAVLSGDDFSVTYPNGDQIGVVSTVFRCRPRVETAPRVNDDESLEMRYFPPGDLPEDMLPRHRWIVAKALENDSDTYFNPASW
ncbi:MAG: NUDIX domain-containing protein [Chloroflexi bacterium]|nr:NUDIX domain-containing protein [Chloroflexota bacterium]